MPQGEKLNKTDIVVPQKEGYTRKPKNVKRGGPMGIIVNERFAAALPSMTRNIEHIIAGKAVQDGAHLIMRDVKDNGSAAVKERASLKRKRNEVSVLLSKGRNAKGVRGEFDVDELAELAPELKKLLTQRAATSGKTTTGGARSSSSSNGGAAAHGGAGSGSSGSGGDGDGREIDFDGEEVRNRDRDTHSEDEEGAAEGEGQGSSSAGAAAAASSSSSSTVGGMSKSKGGKGKGKSKGSGRKLPLLAGGGAGAGAGGAAVFASDAAVADTFGADFV